MFIGIILNLNITKKYTENLNSSKDLNILIYLINQKKYLNLNQFLIQIVIYYFYGTSGSGKTSFLKYYLYQTKSNFIVFGRDETEFSDNYIPLLQLENIEREKLANKTIILDDAGAYKSLKTKVEDLFRFGRHHNILVIYLAHYAKDVLPAVRENCFKIFITINNLDSFFETIVSTYSIKELNRKQYLSQLEFSVIEFDTRSQKYKILNQKYQVVYDTTKHKWSPEDYVKYESCFFYR